MLKIEMRANAKINLALSIIGKRADGYHEIDTVMQSVDLCDFITITKNSALCVSCDGIAEQENLATRAAKLFFRQSGIKGGAYIQIEKHIPISAGLGGGSSDAAAVLMGLNTLYGTGISKQVLSTMAAELGADIPFFLMGGTARAQGIGERLINIDCHIPWHYLLFKEGKKLSTKEMYHRLDGTLYPKPDIDAAVKALYEGNSDAFFAAADNSFSVLWEKTETEDFLLKAGAEQVFLSGSGPTRFAVFRERKAAESAFIQLKEKGMECFLTRPAE